MRGEGAGSRAGDDAQCADAVKTRYRARVIEEAPPSGGEWDEALERTSLAFVDVEATGLDPRNDRVVEVCVERVRGGEVEARLETLVMPGARVGGASHVHGLGAEQLAGAPVFAEIADELVRVLDGAVFVGHGAAWDVGYLEAELERAGRPREVRWYLDTLTLARRAFGLRSNRLGTLAKALSVGVDRQHRAGGDVQTMRGVFARIVQELKPRSARDLWQVRVGEGRARPEILAACEMAVGGEPVVVRYRPSGRAAERFPFSITAVERSLDPPRVMGYLVPGRGRRELRTDRILAVEPLEGSQDDQAPGRT